MLLLLVSFFSRLVTGRFVFSGINPCNCLVPGEKLAESKPSHEIQFIDSLPREFCRGWFFGGEPKSSSKWNFGA
jgi:hypothetical protein